MIGWFRNLFRTAGEVASLTRECLFLQAERERLERRCAILEATVFNERRRFDSFQKTYFNQISVKNGLFGAFTDKAQDDQESEKLQPIERERLNIFEEQELENIAKQFQEQDRAEGVKLPIEHYLNPMKKIPDDYIKVAD